MGRLEDLLEGMSEYKKEKAMKRFTAMGFDDAHYCADVLELYHKYREQVCDEIVRSLHPKVVADAFKDLKVRDFIEEKGYGILQHLGPVAEYKNPDLTRKVAECLNLYDGRTENVYVVNSVLNLNEESQLSKVIDLFIQFADHELSYSVATWMQYVAKEFTEGIELISDILMKYQDNHCGDMIDFFVNYELKLDVSELLSNRAYKAIKNGASIVDIVKSDHCRTAQTFKDEYCKSNCSYSDLDLIKETFDLVEEVNKFRPREYKATITNGFYDELHRAITQTDNPKQKLRNIRIYCNEVKKQMMNRYQELLVVHNA